VRKPTGAQQPVKGQRTRRHIAYSETGSDLSRTTGLTELQVPYPLGFYTRGLDGRIDDPRGLEGRGVWASNDTRVSWHNEGGKGCRLTLLTARSIISLPRSARLSANVDD